MLVLSDRNGLGVYILFIISVVIVCLYSTLFYVFLFCILWASGPEIILSYHYHTLLYISLTTLHVRHYHCFPLLYSSYLLLTCPNHFNRLSFSFFDVSPTFVVPLILSFLDLAMFVNNCNTTVHLNIRISTTSYRFIVINQ